MTVETKLNEKPESIIVHNGANVLKDVSIDVKFNREELGLVLGMLDGGWYDTKQEEILHGFLQKVEKAGSPFQLTDYLDEVCYGKGEEDAA